MLVGVAAMAMLGLPTAAHAGVPFQRTDMVTVGDPLSLAVGDVDGQNGPDLVVTRYDADALNVWLNNGDGTFAAPVGTTGACKASQVELGDVTTSGTDYAPDGKLDVVLFCVDTGGITRMAGDGTGHFGARHDSISLNSPLYNSSDNFALVRFSTIEGVPLPTFRSQDGSFRGVFCALWDYTSDTQCLPPPTSWPAIGGPMVPADLRGDGLQELVTGGGSKGIVVFGITDVPLRQWTYSEAPYGKDEGSGLHPITVGDLSSDGQPDVITGYSTSSEGWISVVNETPAGLSQATPPSFASVAGTRQLVSGDFDGDGHVDVVGVSDYGRAVLHLGDGSGALGAPQDVPLIAYGQPATTATVADAAVADLDRNGTPDVVVLGRAGNLQILHNQAAATVPPPGPGGGSGGGGSGGGAGPAPIVPATPPAPGTAPPPGGTKPPLAPLTGLTGLGSTATATIKGASATVALGKAANPPTRSVAITLTVAGAKASAAAKKRRPKAIIIAKTTISIPAGRTRPLTVSLNATGRALLRRHAKLAVTAALVATGTDGTKATRTRAVTLKRRVARRR
jgi:hypothetical protein